MSVQFNEGVGHGAFAGTFSVAGVVILENYQHERPEAHAILQSDQFGSPLKSASVSGFETATCTAQLNVVGGVGIRIQPGETITIPATHGGGNYYVASAGESYSVGDYWKSNIQLRKRYV